MAKNASSYTAVLVLLATLILSSTAVSQVPKTGHHPTTDVHVQKVACSYAYDCRLTPCVAPVCKDGYCTCPGKPPSGL